MTAANDLMISRLTVRIRLHQSEQTIGTGMIYASEHLGDKIYIITAAHNLFEDRDLFTIPLEKISLDVYNNVTRNYKSIDHTIDHRLISPHIDTDIAILELNRREIESLTGTLPELRVINERSEETAFASKGFPNATQGRELVAISPLWSQVMTGVDKFQLQLTEDYSSWAVSGFSGAGIFASHSNEIFLLGIFTRFRPEESGRTIYAQYLRTVNHILEQNFKHTIAFSFAGGFGVTPVFFKRHIDSAISNLGPRFSKELNFRLPIGKLFNDITRDAIFNQRLEKAVDEWLTQRMYLTESIIPEIDAAQKKLDEVRRMVKSWYATVDTRPGVIIEIEAIYASLKELNDLTSQNLSACYHLQWDKEEKESLAGKDTRYTNYFGAEIAFLGDIQRAIRNFIDALANLNISLSNHPVLLIKGEGGCGKSHMLGDIANLKNKQGKPAVLLLGQLFRSGQGAWQNILTQLGLSCTKAELLRTLDRIGQQTGERVLFMIDALNEGAGHEIWPAELSGLIENIKTYPHIALVLTVRSTYYNSIIPKVVQDDALVTHFTHEGFSGNEYEALRLFCEHFGLQQPRFPILTPEFTNPLFLQLVCIGVSALPGKKFPQGFHGVMSLFDLYLSALSKRFEAKREEYNLRVPNLLVNALRVFAKNCFDQPHSRSLPLPEALKLFDEKFPAHGHLLRDLIQENILVQSTGFSETAEMQTEVLYFAYERLGDFYMAEMLLEPYPIRESMMKAFGKEGELGKLMEESFWRNGGLLEAFAVILPEKFGVEIFESFAWSKEENDNHRYYNIKSELSHLVMNSLKFRKVDSIDDTKLTAWLKSEDFEMGYDQYLLCLEEMATIVNHPFNANRLHWNLLQYTMTQRDAFWQQHIRYYSGHRDNGSAYPIKRLLDWAWQPGISSSLDPETTRLTALVLIWCLASTMITVRDKSTKALVNLLEEQPQVLIGLLETFKDTNDMYILERLYAVVYGCALRTTSAEGCRNIAQYVYDIIFKDRNPPEHLLLRDYARNTIECALHRSLAVQADPEHFRPPYQSAMPLMPEQTVIDALNKDPSHPEFQAKHWFYQNAIIHSVMVWDFGRYVVESALHNFHPVSFTAKKSYSDFLSALPKKVRYAVTAFGKVDSFKVNLTNKKTEFIRKNSELVYEQNLSKTNIKLQRLQESLDNSLTVEQSKFLRERGVSHLRTILRTTNWQRNFFETEPIKRWIVQRVFELGYNPELHGLYESSVESYNNRSENKMERIGKKYQWIAFYEIMSLIADNFKVNEKGGRDKIAFYNGPWLGYLRDIDPAFTTRKALRYHNGQEEDNENVYDIGVTPTIPWWSEQLYTHWNIPGEKWLTLKDDLPDPATVIAKQDGQGNPWLYLSRYQKWEQPKAIGEDRYNRVKKSIDYHIQSYLVKQKDLPAVITALRKKRNHYNWMPESNKANLNLINRENYWAPATENNEKETWHKIDGTNLPLKVTITEAVGEMSDDKSGAHFMYDMPCKLFFEGMEMNYSKIDGDFCNAQGETIVSADNPDGLLIRADALQRFLNEKKLAMIWVLNGEKIDWRNTGRPRAGIFVKVISGVYAFEDGRLQGKIELSKRD